MQIKYKYDMEAKEKNLEEYVHPEGVEVKMNMGRMHTIMAYLVLIFFIGGSLLFNYVWGGVSEYQAGHEFGKVLRTLLFSLKGISIMALCFLTCLAIQYVLLFWFSGKDRHAIRWYKDWMLSNFLLVKPIALKYYRLVLLIPFLLMGVFPMVHGFCTGNLGVYIVGVICSGICCGDCYYFWKLRSFGDNDKIVDGEKPFSATIIKGTY